MIELTAMHAARDELLVTAEGYSMLRDEIDTLTTEGRRETAERLRVAHEDGDLADNLDLFDALEEQALLERRIAILEARLAAARIADGRGNDGSVAIGTRVRLRDLESDEIVEYDLVGTIEADPAEGKISVEAPVGRALAGRRPDAVVEVETPRGITRLEVLAVTSADADYAPRKVA